MEGLWWCLFRTRIDSDGDFQKPEDESQLAPYNGWGRLSFTTLVLCIHISFLSYSSYLDLLGKTYHMCVSVSGQTESTHPMPFLQDTCSYCSFLDHPYSRVTVNFFFLWYPILFNLKARFPKGPKFIFETIFKIFFLSIFLIHVFLKFISYLNFVSKIERILCSSMGHEGDLRKQAQNA